MVDRSLRFEAPESSRKMLKMSRRPAQRSLRRNRRGIAPLVLGIVVVVIAVVVVAGGLFAAGVFTPKSSGGGTSATFAVTFTETGLLLGGSWSVTLGGSTQSSSSSSIQFNVANGSYSYSVSAAGYTALPSSGTLTVNGQPVSRAITITPIPTYSVVFTESALPSGTSWSVTLNGSTQSSVTSSITFTVPNGAYAYTVGTVSGYAASPLSGTITVSGAAVSQAIAFTKQTTYPVEFSETGLGVGTSWTVTLGGVAQSSTTNTITFSEPNGTYTYTVGSVSGYTASPSSGSITVLGAALTIAVTFTAAVATTYSVTFSETGLPLGTSWAVTLNGGTTSSSTSTIVFTEANGTYAYSVGAVSGYSASPSSGSVTVAGAAQSIAITFSSVAPGAYPVTFSQTGLPGNESWSAMVYAGTFPFTSIPLIAGQSGEGASIEFAIPNGAYFFFVTASNSSYLSTPTYGNITVAGGPVNVPIVFTAVTPTSTTFSVTFTETGLPGGSQWAVLMNGTSQSSPAGSPIVFSVQNGTYYYNDITTTASGYDATPSSGDAVVNGHALTIAIRFQPAYTVTFTETGLTGSAAWQVTLNGSKVMSLGYSNITFDVPNGNYAFAASAAGYTASPASGTVTVAGAPVSQAITFTPTVPPPKYSVTFTESGLPASSFWSVVVYSAGSLFSGASNYSESTTLTVSVPNGYYTWVLAFAPAGYVASPSAGGLVINGAGASESLAFTYAPADRLVLFAEFDYSFFGAYGIPNGTSWSVTLHGVTQTTTGMFMVFYEVNGTYSYTITPPAGYVAVPSSGTLTINSTLTSFEFFNPSAEVYVAFAQGAPTAAAGVGVGSPLAASPPSVARLISWSVGLGRPTGP